MKTLKNIASSVSVGSFVVAGMCLKPMPPKQKAAWRPVCSRLQLVLEIIKLSGVNQKSGISVDNVLAFMKGSETFTHSNGEVRDVTKSCCVAMQKVVGSDAILPQLEPVLRKQQLDDYKLAFGVDTNQPEIPEKQTASPESAKVSHAPTHNNHGTPHKSPVKKGKHHDQEAPSDEPPSYTTCMFCGIQDPTWNEDGLDLHFWKDCTMLTKCPACSQITEIAGLPQHLTQECEKSSEYVFDDVTGMNGYSMYLEVIIMC